MPQQIIAELPNDCENFVHSSRFAVHKILTGADDRLLAVIGPCSIHSEQVALEYAGKLAELTAELTAHLFVVMRVYFEKPRTTVGWKGLINDPYLNGTHNVNDGLRLARKILLKINRLGVPCGTETLDVFTPQYIADLLTWGAIGARTTESQVHRELASGMSCPMGFKNGTDGNIDIAADAVRAAHQPHRFMSITKQGRCAVSETSGNEDTHVILRGGKLGPNHDAASVAAAVAKLAESGLPGKLMVDFSHANSGKNFRRQHEACQSVRAQLEAGDIHIMGVMAESNLREGKQAVVPGQELEYGVSITDGCMGWEDTAQMLRNLADSVRVRRQLRVEQD